MDMDMSIYEVDSISVDSYSSGDFDLKGFLI